MRLYKYRDLRSPEGLSRLEEILHTQSFWAARPDTLNDPAEFRWNCDFSPTPRTTLLLAEVLHRTKVKSASEALFLASRAVQHNRLQEYAAPAFSLLQARCRDEVGLVCFATSEDDQLLWDRYGGSGVGACVELDASPHLLTTELHYVEYVNSKVLHVDAVLEGSLNKVALTAFYRAAFLTKPISWRAEQEVRFVCKRQAVSVKLDKSPFLGIRLGSHTTKHLETSVREIVKGLPYPLSVHHAAA